MTARRRRPAGGGVRTTSGPRAGSSAAPPIRFGTSGWRGPLAGEVTFARLQRLTRAIARWLAEQRARGSVLIGYDGRFASRALAEAAQDSLRAAGRATELVGRFTPTPVVTHALARSRGRYAAGLVLTASHNPPPDHGLKLFGATGAAVDDEAARRIERLAQADRDRAPEPHVLPERRRRRGDDPGERYLADLAALLDRDAIRRSGLTLVHDAMHGAAAGHLDALMRRLGLVVVGLRDSVDPNFGGASPDPTAQRLSALVQVVGTTRGPVVGIANDGDADRVGVVDGRGRVLSETQVLALLVDHLAACGRIGRGVAIGVATGSLVEKVACAHGLSVERHPIGFKHLSRALLAGRVDVAGEESGGFAWAPMGPDKDGLLAGALLVERVARSGRSLEQDLDTLEARHGASACGRIARATSARIERGLARLAASPPERLGRTRIERVDRSDGLHFAFGDGGFLMFRRSGTEAVIRLYAEARDATALGQRLSDGERLLARAAAV